MKHPVFGHEVQNCITPLAVSRFFCKLLMSSEWYLNYENLKGKLQG